MENKLREHSIEINSLKKDCSKYELNIAIMGEKIEEINIKIDDIKKNQESYMDDMKLFMKEIADSKANKWVENFLLWAGGIIGTSLLVGFLTLVYRITVYMGK